MAEAPDLDVVGMEGDCLREVLVHMIEEYARQTATQTFCASGSTEEWASSRRGRARSPHVRGELGQKVHFSMSMRMNGAGRVEWMASPSTRTSPSKVT